METRSPHSHPDRLLTRQQMQRLEEPWFLNKAVAIVAGLLLAILLGYLGASGDVESLILAAVWITAIAIIVFVRDYWWSPALIITALSFHTLALGFAMTGLEIGVIILFLTFPVKIAMKTLRPVTPALPLGFSFWSLLVFISFHCLIILFYSKIEGVQLKNILKAYYQVITPIVFYGLLLRYCEPRTVRPTAVAIFMTTLAVSIVSIPIIFLNLPLGVLTTLKISVDWVNSAGAAALFRYTGPFLLMATLAWWPVAKSSKTKLFLLGSLALGIFGTLLSGGRLSFVECLVAGLVFSILRKKIWISVLFALFLLCVSLLISANPRILYLFPDIIHRTLLPLELTGEVTEIKEKNAGSDKWHHDLLVRSLDYWFADTNSIFFGHGYKSWDDSIDTDPEYLANPELMILNAIEMGRTENMFSSITNIFGATGLVLYALFMLNLAWMLWRAMRASPLGSSARALCEFSLINLGLQIFFAPVVGSTPSLNIIYWGLGLLAARPYISDVPVKHSVERQSFDLSRETPIPPRGRLPNCPPKALVPGQISRPRLQPRRG